VDGVKLYPMFLAFVRAGYVYADVSEILARVLMKCNEMGGMAAEGVGYGIAFIYSKGMVDVSVAAAVLAVCWCYRSCAPSL